MKTKEFRLENLIEADGNIISIGDIQESFIAWKISTNPKNVIWNPYISINDPRLKPIPLTEEILINNCMFNTDYYQGFVGIDVNHSDFVLTKPKVMGEFQKHFAFQYNSGNLSKFVEFEFLHQLQNFFYDLNKKELEVKFQK